SPFTEIEHSRSEACCLTFSYEISQHGAPANITIAALQHARTFNLKFLRSAAHVTVKAAVNSGAIELIAERTAFLIAAPDLAQGRKLFAFKRRLGAGRAEDHGNLIAAGTIDLIPQRADLFQRHPIL